MRRLFIFSLISVMFFSLIGCDQYKRAFRRYKKKKQRTEKAQKMIEPVSDINLAELILKPKKHTITVTRDPFKPLVTEEKRQSTATITKDGEVAVETAEVVLKDIQLQGLVKVGNSFSALLRSEDDKGVFQIGDKFGELKIVDIGEDYVEFKKGINTFKLKRGE